MNTLSATKRVAMLAFLTTALSGGGTPRVVPARLKK